MLQIGYDKIEFVWVLWLFVLDFPVFVSVSVFLRRYSHVTNVRDVCSTYENPRYSGNY